MTENLAENLAVKRKTTTFVPLRVWCRRTLTVSDTHITHMIKDEITPILEQDRVDAAQALIAGSTKIVVCTHMSPDGDACGSALALAGYLRRKGKQATVVFNDAPGDNLNFIPGVRDAYVADSQRKLGVRDTRPESLRAIREADLFMITDLNTPLRMGELGKEVMAQSARKVLIDHHLDPDPDSFDIVMSHPESSAASELVYNFILQSGDDSLLDATTASQIYCGMMTDTGQFVFSSNRPQVYLIVARLLQEGFDKESLHRQLVLEPERRTRLKGYVLSEKLKIVPGTVGGAYFSLNKAELKRFNHQKGDSEGFVNLPLDIYGIKVSAFFREEKNFVKVSLRSKGDYPVNLMAQRFYNGGGHRNAAGGEFYGTLEQAEQLYVKALPLFVPKATPSV